MAAESLSLPPAAQRPTSRTVGRVLLYVLLAVATAILLLPFYWMIVSSLKDDGSVYTLPIKWIPPRPLWDHYVSIWTLQGSGSGMLTWMKNTLILSVVVTFLQVLTGSFAAYGFAKVRFPGRDALFLLYIGTIALPWQSYMIPQFVMFAKFKVVDTLWSIILLQAFGAFGVFLMKQFYETIPEELSEAARIDGLSEYGIWRRVILPLSMPAVASLSLLTFVNTWNDYLGPLLYLRSPGVRTIQLGLARFLNDHQAFYAQMMTGAVISVLPIAIIFMIGQRYFVEGIATTGLKG